MTKFNHLFPHLKIKLHKTYRLSNLLQTSEGMVSKKISENSTR